MEKARKIIHIDMDCFYAAVEMREDPSLQGKPVAVGGSPSQRGVLATCNYEARKFGLHSAMSSAQAMKYCPKLILIPPNFALYRQISTQIHEIFRRYTTIIEPLSLDEAYLDVTDCEQCSGSATWIAQEIRQAIFQELNLTASAGVAPLKFLAKIASDQNKPNGQFVITPEDVPAFVQTLALRKIPGVGKVTAEKLMRMGLHTCGEIQRYSKPKLLAAFGKIGQRIWDFSHGIDAREVQPHRVRKSVGVEMTLVEDIDTLEQARFIFDDLYEKLLSRLKKHQEITLSQLNKLGVKLKFDDFQTTTLEKSTMTFSSESFWQLLTQIWQRRVGRKVRLIGVHVHLPDNTEQNRQKQDQMSLW
ncbi:DNA polymerase IV [Conservatibacter flavescens]|uniref:DNA polymerase IV n=1 Tax=Conservatibacter flavescens TaxID=28161 RepID=A0A2M8S5K6_9PAST|nr:DNA polymerase IV [Conservatibacter flavescens]PJG86388.1 DNA polymerase IV [Conservatibacter flavescens]